MSVLAWLKTIVAESTLSRTDSLPDRHESAATSLYACPPCSVTYIDTELHSCPRCGEPIEEIPTGAELGFADGV